MKSLRVIFGVILSVMVGFGTSGVVQAVSSGFGGRPANPDPDIPRSQSIFIYNMEPGASKNDALRVQNTSDEEITVELFVVDGTVTNTGSFTCKQNFEPKTDAGGWISLNQAEVTVGAKQTTDVGFKVDVPEKADVGEHSGCIAMQLKKQNTEDNAEGAIRLTTRQAIRVAITVPGDIRRQVEIAGFKAVQDGGAQNYEVDLKNTGNVSADVTLDLKVKDAFGGTFYENGGQYPVIRGESLQLSFRNEKRPFWGGWYDVELTASYDKRAEVFGTDDPANLEHLKADVVTVFFWPTWQAMAMIAGLLVVLTGGVWWLVKGRKSRRVSLKK